MIGSYDVIVSAQHAVGRATIYPAPESRQGIALLSSSAGGENEPSDIFEELALYCQSAGITAFLFRLSAPHLFVPTVLDLRAVVAAMSERDVERVVLVVEAATRRTASFAPIAYRSIVGLVEKVVGVATILPLTQERPEKLPRALPPDLIFLLRSARVRSGGPAACREVARADGMSELFLAPGWLRSRADGLSTIVAPVFSWAQRTLQHPPLLSPGIPDADFTATMLEQEVIFGAPTSLAEPSAVEPSKGTTSAYRQVFVWLAQEWRRILEEQVARDPSRVLPADLAAAERTTGLSAKTIHRRVARVLPGLDHTAHQEWCAAYIRGSCMVAEMTAVNAALPLSNDSECGA